MKICFVVTVPFSAKHFLLPYMNILAKENEVFLVSNFGDNQVALEDFEGIHIVHISISRKISLIADIKALYRLYCFMRREKFKIVHSYTPKAGLLSMISSRLAGVPLRFHTFTGQVWLTKSGVFRWFLKVLDRLIFRCATGVLIDSSSQREFLLDEGVVNKNKSHVLGYGSFCGVDCEKFKPDAEKRTEIRRRYAIPDNALLFLFIGRINRDKGINELVEAFSLIAEEYCETYLLVVGPDEEMMIEKLKKRALYKSRRILCEGYTTKPEEFMAAADVFCLPSHREGFGSVIIEAAAAGIPAIGSNIYGVSDAIVAGQTGILHRKGDVDGIYNAMKKLISEPILLKKMGDAAYNRALRDFSQNLLVNEFLSYYDKMLSGKRNND